jgi:hypothetical protein
MTTLAAVETRTPTQAPTWVGSRALHRQVLLACALLIVFRTFQFFPYFIFVHEAWSVLSLLALFVVYPFWKIRQGLRFSGFEIYLLLLIGFAFVVPPWVASYGIGQPLIYGVLAQRATAMLVFPLFLVSAIRLRRVRLEDLEKALLMAAWGTYFLFTAIRILLRPESFDTSGIGFVMEVEDELAFRLPTFAITFGAVYYLLRGLRERRWKYFLYALILLTSIGGKVAGTGRGQTVCLAITAIAFLYRIRPWRGFLADAFKAGLIAAIVIGTMTVLAPSEMGARGSKWIDAFTVVLRGAEVEDMSANARLLEVLAAMPSIQQNPTMGLGAYSNQWRNGLKNSITDYLFPNDIGLLGGMLVFGAVGCVVYALQYIFSLRALRRLGRIQSTPFIDGCVGITLFFALSSITTGIFIFESEVTLTFIAILVGTADLYAPDANRPATSPSPHKEL